MQYLYYLFFIMGSRIHGVNPIPGFRPRVALLWCLLRFARSVVTPDAQLGRSLYDLSRPWVA